MNNKIESELQFKLDELERWKKEALIVIDSWQKIWVELGRPGKLGDQISTASLEEVKRIKSQLSNYNSAFQKLEANPRVTSYSIKGDRFGIEANINLFSKNLKDISLLIEKLTDEN